MSAAGLATSLGHAPWLARLELEYERNGTRSVLARRRTLGPLAIQKTLYPEGDAVAHNIVLHPPGGVVGGDELAIDIALGAGAHALLTTPGAGKWYRSPARGSKQRLRFTVGANGILEWLPQETILFDGARASLGMQLELSDGARFIGWDILCLGRAAGQERFDSGELAIDARVAIAGTTRWLERGRVQGGDLLLSSPIGLGGATVLGTMLIAGALTPEQRLEALAKVRALVCVKPDRFAVTALNDLLVARFLGESGARARGLFTGAWRIVRPLLANRSAHLPRIWAT